MDLANYIHVLSILALAPAESRAEALEFVRQLDDEQWSSLAAVASAHHVALRAFGGHEESNAPTCVAALVRAEFNRMYCALKRLSEVCAVLEENRCTTVVVKSLDHWPDLGTDLDLLTCSAEVNVTKILQKEFGASIESSTWSDRVAHKINYRLPELPELIEIHFGRLGQAGEHVGLASQIVERRVLQQVGEHRFFVPSPEDRILLATLQRLYRHFYIRVCDFVNAASLIDSGAIDFEQLRSRAKQAGIWPGTATFVLLVSDYVSHYRCQPLMAPRHFTLASRFGIEKIFASTGFLRVPMFPQAAELYLKQVAKSLRRRDPVSSARLGLIPPLALAATLRHKLTGNQYGIW